MGFAVSGSTCVNGLKRALIYAPGLNVGVASSPLESFGPIIFMQLLLSLAGIVFTAKDKQKFT